MATLDQHPPRAELVQLLAASRASVVWMDPAFRPRRASASGCLGSHRGQGEELSEVG